MSEPAQAALLARCAVCGPLPEGTRLYAIGTYLAHEVPTGYANPTTPADEVEPCGPVTEDRVAPAGIDPWATSSQPGTPQSSPKAHQIDPECPCDTCWKYTSGATYV